MWSYEKLSAKFLVSNVKVIDLSVTRTSIKIPLNADSIISLLASASNVQIIDIDNENEFLM